MTDLNFKRPDKELVELFRNIPVANIDDCMERTAAVDSAIRPINGAALLGPAYTVRVAPGDNLYFHKALDLAQPGDIVVIDAGGHTQRAIFGALMINYLRVRGIAGVIVDGAVRDVEELREMDDISIYARAITPNGPYKNGPGELCATVSFGGKPVRPGDIIVGDADGIIVIPPEQAKEIHAQTLAVMDKEAKILEGILKDHAYPRPWLK